MAAMLARRAGLGGQHHAMRVRSRSRWAASWLRKVSIARAMKHADIGSSFSGMPFSNTTTAHISELRFTARQSRLSILAQGDVDSDTHLAFYGEFDFLGGPQTGNSNESNSYNPRIRNIYGTVDWDAEGLELLAGQNWSLLTAQQPRHHAAQRSDAGHHRRAICPWASTGPASRSCASSRTGIMSSGWRSRWKIPRPPSPANARAATGVTVGGQHRRRLGVQQDANMLLAQPCSGRDRQGGLGADDRRRPAAAYGSLRHLPRLL